MWNEPTINDVSLAVAQCLADQDEASALRLALRFVERFDVSGSDVRIAIISEKPTETGSSRFDALLAAVVDYSCFVHLMAAPAWVDEPSRFLEEMWFPSNLKGLEADALAYSPTPFARRGVFLNSGALDYA